MLISTDSQRRIRQIELEEEENKKQIETEKLRKNKNFTQVYPKGWEKIIKLAKYNAGASGLYAFFAQHIDPSCGAVICDQQFLATQFDVSTRTIRNWLNYLESENTIIKIPVSGRVYAYALDPHEVWKGYDTSKEYAAFLTKTLVNKDESIQRKIISMFKRDNKENLKDNYPNEIAL
jgi:hypothetical protein